MKGKIIKGIAGFYYVHAGDALHSADGIYECKAKGVFRKDHRKPLVGDDVEMEVIDEAQKKGNITELLPRHSELIRPAVANVDQALVIFAICKPQPNFNLLDRFLIMMQQQDIPCIICFNKQDIDAEGKKEDYRSIYEQAGIVMETGSISEKIERGKHTTRHSELISIAPDTYILDTPGFSSLGLFGLEKEQLAGYYPEFVPFEKYCRFGGCSHISEPVCGVKDAVAEGEISRTRYENYCLLYEELKSQRKY